MFQQEVMDKSHKTVFTNHNLSEEKGELKWDRTEVLPLTSLMPYRQAKPAHILKSEFFSSFCSHGATGEKGVYPKNQCMICVVLLESVDDDKLMLNVLRCHETYQ